MIYPSLHTSLYVTLQEPARQGISLLDSLHSGLCADLPEAAVSKLSIEDALALQTQLAIGKPSLSGQSVQDLEQQQERWIGSARVPVEPATKPYIHRQRLALELRVRAHKKPKHQVNPHTHT